jgi:hypothetical protein
MQLLVNLPDMPMSQLHQWLPDELNELQLVSTASGFEVLSITHIFRVLPMSENKRCHGRRCILLGWSRRHGIMDRSGAFG